ncbi:5,10-methylenetetrahydromethanopterin reductase [Archaeoglobus profundus]|uniref:5,10-methylenetetrahydromethanopterin reductase n=1 Tax=Archaeoglobus profundus (strain DSM 5631 / JCM 9629 / NBRC 100127 / Av18) TaxID=572546 RepID=D2RET7_ARCPA|nr:5,10-methylenetetrahydromethanopterin reductase [Archaeoglobus profundus]ADB58631.1 5,10-methylenetetrahydromethanopterin reductase [Archaeoglobus profundus DSM 5631]
MELGIELKPDKPFYEIEYLAKLAEDYEYDYIWITEHYNNRNPIPILTTIALKTHRAKIGVGATNPYTTHPALIASIIFTLDEISGGRAVLGISAGDKMTLNSLGIRREKPLKTVKEAVELIKALMNGRTYEGDLFKCMSVIPFARRVPIFVGAQGSKMIELALEIGDGVILNATLPEIKTSKTVGLCMPVCVDDDVDRAKKIAKIVVAFIIAGSSRSFAEKEGIPYDVVTDIRKKISKGKFDEIKIDDELIDKFCLYGKVNDVVARIESFNVDIFIVGTPIGRDKVKAIKEIGKKIKGR